MDRLLGKTALITGGARGYGAAVARLFAAEGAAVVITDVLTTEGQELALEIGAEFIYQDVAHEQSWAELTQKLSASYASVDVLLNNAAILQAESLINHRTSSWEKVIQINQTAVFYGMRELGKLMSSQQSGSIINVSSVAVHQCTETSLAYTASKCAVVGMTKVAAKELGPVGVRVNAILPGMMDTKMVEDLDPERLVREKLSKSIPLRRTASADEIAPMALFLASDESSYCTGECFQVDGGSAC